MASSRAKALYLALQAEVKGLEYRELGVVPTLPEVLASLPRLTDADKAALLKALGKKWTTREGPSIIEGPLRWWRQRSDAGRMQPARMSGVNSEIRSATISVVPID